MDDQGKRTTGINELCCMARSLDKTQLGYVSFCREAEGTSAKGRLNLSNKREKFTL